MLNASVHEYTSLEVSDAFGSAQNASKAEVAAEFSGWFRHTHIRPDQDRGFQVGPLAPGVQSLLALPCLALPFLADYAKKLEGK